MAGLNSSQIQDRARSMGYNLSDSDTQNVLKNTYSASQYGADAGQVDSYLKNNYGGGGSSSYGQGLQNMFGAQRAANSSFLDRYRQAVSSMPSVADQAKTIGSQIGLDKLQANAQGLNNTLFNIPQSQRSATMGFGVNANQLGRLIAQKQSEIAPSAALAGQNAQAAEANVNTRLGYAQQDQQRALLPFQAEQQMMNDQNAREATGYTQQMNNELSATIAKMNAGVTVSEGEKQRAHDLAVRELDYKRQMSTMSQQNTNAQDLERLRSSLNPNYMNVGVGSNIVNPHTGEVVYKSSGAGGGVSGILGPPRPTGLSSMTPTTNASKLSIPKQVPSYAKKVQS